MSFSHLHVHTHYSILEASCRIPDLVELAHKDKMDTLAITDLGNMFGAVEFYYACKEKEINPILGLEVYLSPKGRFVREKGSSDYLRAVLLAKNYKGYQNLSHISSCGYKEGFYYKPRVDYEILEKYSSDIICLSGGFYGIIPWTFLHAGKDQALEIIKTFQKIYKDSFYLELNRLKGKSWDKMNDFLLEVSDDLKIPHLACNEIYYTSPEDRLVQEALVCIGSGALLRDDRRPHLEGEDHYFKTSKQMKELFSDLPEACERTLEISKKCNMEFKNLDSSGRPIYHLPSYSATKAGLRQEMKKLTYEGLEKRFQEAKERKEEVEEGQKKIYKERLEYELKVINQMGFTGYFLIVQDFIRWAKSQNIPVGPGRGSGAGSLVAYCLFITDVDPIYHNLLFERFLNPERISMPDFDVDFCQERRDEIIDYVTRKYGESNVAQIITFGRLQTRAAVRDMGRILGMTYKEVDDVVKLIPEKLGISIQEAIEAEPLIKEAMDGDSRVKTMIDLSQRVEGLSRHAGIHASGIIIADVSIQDYVPLYKGLEGENVVQYDMKNAEKLGLVKFDFLGLKTLTLIDKAIKLIEKNKGTKINIRNISLNDKGIYEVMKKGSTLGIFQFEGRGITDLIIKAQPSCFEDIVAINALYRPGPMEMIPEYLKRKKKEANFTYLFKEMEEITKETHGVIIYQEQVQLIASKIANYSLGEADILRRAMGKKISKIMKKQKKRFLSGAKKNKHDIKKAEKLFDLVSEFAKYGFNKSHAVAYCLITAYTAYLKNYYPEEFFASLLTTEMNDSDKLLKYIKDMRRHGVQIHPPCVNTSSYHFDVEGKGIRFSLGAIKGLGKKAVDSIIEARNEFKDQIFPDLEGFLFSVSKKKVNKKSLESLVKSGALDSFGYPRSYIFENSSKLVAKADKDSQNLGAGQRSLFDGEEKNETSSKIFSNWSRVAELNYEKEVIGFYLSDHPLRCFSCLKGKFSPHKAYLTERVREGEGVEIIGLVTSIKEVITRKGTKMSYGQIEDLSGSVEVVLFPEIHEKKFHIIQSGSPLYIKGYVNKRKGSQIVVRHVNTLEDRLKKIKSLTFSFESREKKEKFEEVKKILSKHSGKACLDVEFKNEPATIRKKIMTPYKINVNTSFFEEIYPHLGPKDDMSLGA